MAADLPRTELIKARIRLDIKGVAKSARFLFGGKSTEKVAEEAREQSVSLFRNVPLQGVRIIDIDMGMAVYMVFDEIINAQVAYAPIVLDVEADTVEDLLKLAARDDFRTIDITSPPVMQLTQQEIERILFRASEELKSYKSLLERKYYFK